MEIPSEGIIAVVHDSRGRDLVILRAKKGQILYVLKRYKDMLPEDKDIVRTAYEHASQHAVAGAEEGSAIDDIEAFLSFSENRLCG